MTNRSIIPSSRKYFIAIIALMAIFLGLLWVGESSLDDRMITTRYLLLILAAMTAFSTPYLLFPDRNCTLLQLGNVSSKELMIYLMKKIMKLIWPVYLLIAVMMIGDIHSFDRFLIPKIVYLFVVYLILSALILVSITRYVKSGLDSQFWKESERGRDIRKKMADYFKYPIDSGSIPSLINTVWVTTLGFAMIVISAMLGQSMSGIGVFIFSALFFALSVVYTYSNSDSILKNYYASNAFFLEFFGSNLKGEDLTTKHEVVHLWWVPVKLKVHVWQFLVQIDRKLPAGRVVFTGHLLIWFIAYQRPEPEFITVVWIIFAVLHHLFTVLTFQIEMSPGWLHRWLASGWVWFGSRFWMQLRWVVPLAMSMNAQFFVFGTPNFEIQLQVLSLYIIFAMFISAYGISALNKEGSY